MLLAPADKRIPGLEVERRRAPSGYGQPLAFPDHRIAQLLAHQLGAVKVVLLDENLVTSLDVFGHHQQLEVHLPQDRLFVRCGATEMSNVLCHAPEVKKLLPGCPVQSG